MHHVYRILPTFPWIFMNPQCDIHFWFNQNLTQTIWGEFGGKFRFSLQWYFRRLQQICSAPCAISLYYMEQMHIDMTLKAFIKERMKRNIYILVGCCKHKPCVVHPLSLRDPLFTLEEIYTIGSWRSNCVGFYNFKWSSARFYSAILCTWRIYWQEGICQKLHPFVDK